MEPQLEWVVPVGGPACRGLLVGSCVFGLIMYVSSLVRSSDAYKEAMARAQASPAVQAALGTPITSGSLPSGNISVSGSTGSADISISISGPKGKGTLYVVAVKSAGTWEFNTLEVQVEGMPERINLMEEQKAE